jgi:uncharacterized protein (DUF2384 family)
MTALWDDTIAPDVAGQAFWAGAGELFADLNAATATLATATEVTEPVADAVGRLVQAVAPLSPPAFDAADPYLVEALLTGTVGCAQAIWATEPAARRSELRVPLERARQALRDLLDERNVAADRPAKAVARWLVEVTELPQHELAQLVGVATRTFQRWISDSEQAAPAGDDETRLRTLARTIDQLRWSMTPSGAVRWLQRPHPALDGGRPADLLAEPLGYSELPKLAASTRGMVAG